ncbi:hypothetical protein GCM10010329_81760 [Streptomyces spiroverticillatus]|uniref:Uncharacterized protein n=1 Tax=Streptomyces finlayi TaxID=67296 RepID=A0A918X8S3_9ACTN|nr:hypothetical protein GCM10010329_81760 [Streptomyces spiroverticillatus]GHD18247.1 hypothetical protein GCM10010334_80840 [Streptomyces finlayi]
MYRLPPGGQHKLVVQLARQLRLAPAFRRASAGSLRATARTRVPALAASSTFD